MNPKKRYWHDYVGYNYGTNIQAAIGCAQLERIDYFAKKGINYLKDMTIICLKGAILIIK